MHFNNKYTCIHHRQTDRHTYAENVVDTYGSMGRVHCQREMKKKMNKFLDSVTLSHIVQNVIRRANMPLQKKNEFS